MKALQSEASWAFLLLAYPRICGLADHIGFQHLSFLSPQHEYLLQAPLPKYSLAFCGINFIKLALLACVIVAFISSCLSLQLVLHVRRGVTGHISDGVLQASGALPSRPSIPKYSSLRGKRFNLFSSKNRLNITEIPLTSTDLQIQIERGKIDSFPDLHHWFSYEAPDLKSVYEEADDPKGLVLHRLYWNGHPTRLPEALNATPIFSISNLTITSCSLSVGDISVLLYQAAFLESLSVKELTSESLILDNLHPLHNHEFSHKLNSLQLTSHSNIGPLFGQISFIRLRNLSLRLYGQGNETPVEEFGLNWDRLRSLRLRCRLLKGEKARITQQFQGGLHDLDVENIWLA